MKRAVKRRYYLSADEKYLITRESFKKKHGPLKPIDSIKAIVRFGLLTLEESIKYGIAETTL